MSKKVEDATLKAYKSDSKTKTKKNTEMFSKQEGLEMELEALLLTGEEMIEEIKASGAIFTDSLTADQKLDFMNYQNKLTEYRGLIEKGIELESRITNIEEVNAKRDKTTKAVKASD